MAFTDGEEPVISKTLDLLPEELARIKIDQQLRNAGWSVIDRDEYVPVNGPAAVRESLMLGNKKKSDYLLYIDNKAIAVVEAKKEDNDLGPKVASQAEAYALAPPKWIGIWRDGVVPLVYLDNGNKKIRICTEVIKET